MATIDFPACSIAGFNLGVSDQGRVRYTSQYTPSEFVVDAGFTRLAGWARFAPATWAEDADLLRFILEVGMDGANDTMVPIFQDKHRQGEGFVFPFGTTFAAPTVADSGDDATAITFGFTVPNRGSLSQIELHKGAVLTLNGTLVYFTADPTYAPPATGVVGAVSGVVKPRVASASPNVISEAVVKARFRESQAGVSRTTKAGLDPIQMSWTQVP